MDLQDVQNANVLTLCQFLSFVCVFSVHINI